MSARGVAVHVGLAAVLLAGAAHAAAPRAARAEGRDLDLVAVAQPSDHRRTDTDAVAAEVVARTDDPDVEVVATTTTGCDGCRGESTVLQVLYVPGQASTRVDNVASAWTQDCWDCSATALSVQVVVVGAGTRVRAANTAIAAGQACASCGTATAAFQVVVQVDEVARLPEATLAELRAWFDAEAALLRSAVVAPAAPRRAERVAARSLGDLREVVVRALDGRTRSARVAVTR